MDDDTAPGDGRPDLRTIPKPDELLALHSVTEHLFEMLRYWFDVPDTVELDIRTIDSATEELTDPVLIAAMAMRKLQALHVLSTPGVLTTTDVIVTIVSDLDRALFQAPTMRLKVQMAETDWDYEFTKLAGDHPPEGPAEADASDDEAETFEGLHAMLHMAVHAVLEASDGEICYLS